MAARVLLALAAISAAWATLLTLGGGIDLHIAGRTITSNDPVRPLVLASLLFTTYLLISGDRTLLDRWTRWFDSLGDGRLALLIAVGTMVLGIVYSATAGIASDGYGYVSEADLWIRRNLFIPQPLIGAAPWPEPQWTFAPLGYRPVPWQGTWAFVPIYSSGLPMVLAAAKILGGQEFMYWVVPAFGGLLTWMTFGIGRRLGSPRAGLIACWLVATSPVCASDADAADVGRTGGGRMDDRRSSLPSEERTGTPPSPVWLRRSRFSSGRTSQRLRAFCGSGGCFVLTTPAPSRHGATASTSRRRSCIPSARPQASW